MRFFSACLSGLLLAASAHGQALRLKSRVPLHHEERIAASGHYILQFRSFPGRTIRDQLAQRNIRVLGYVPDSGLMVSAAGPTDLDGLDVALTGSLDPAAKISPVLAELSYSANLVIFYSDVPMDRARDILVAEGFRILENASMLPGQWVVSGSYDGLQALASHDEVAYIMPASADLVSGNVVWGCAGAMTEAGVIGDYVEVGHGWSKDANGSVGLRYVFDSMTNKLEGSGVRGEIDRAFAEWSKYSNVTFAANDAGTATDARTVAIQFASRAHGDPYPFDGPGGVLAHTFYPAPPNAEPVAGDMHFDADEDWHIGTNIDLFSVALHEAGHALGLGHSDRPGSVMYPYYRMSTGLTSDDIAGIQDLYGAKGPSTQPLPTQPPSSPTAPPATPAAPSPPSGSPGGDTVPPAVQILSPGGTIVSVGTTTIHITGTASDNVGLSAVKYNTSSGDTGTATGTTSWTADVPLLIGTTVVTIRAYDAAGNSGWRAITVVRH